MCIPYKKDIVRVVFVRLPSYICVVRSSVHFLIIVKESILAVNMHKNPLT